MAIKKYFTDEAKPKPFVKWVGGKRSILDKILQHLPKNFHNYYEPFVGGGALFFELYNYAKKSYLSDLNIDLIIAYKIIQTNPSKLCDLLKEHQKKHCKEYYYKIRSLQDLDNPIDTAARFIYLITTCYNGLYRVNNKNEFNTPIGSYVNPLICNEENIFLVNNSLKNTDIKYQDFTKIEPSKGDFVYFDPPYHPTAQGAFVKYVKGGFNENDQVRLRDFALDLSKSGVNVMISNSDISFIIDLYCKKFNIQKIQAPRFVNCKADKRKSVSELLITNY